MGYGEVLGNASVHWRVVHEEYEEASAAPASRARGRATQANDRRLARARLRTADVPENVPAQHVGNLDVLDYEARGKDTVTLDQVGNCCGTKDHDGHFRVRMRFTSLARAKRAVAKAALNIRKEGKMFVVTMDVPVIERNEEQVGPPADPPAEVRVDW